MHRLFHATWAAAVLLAAAICANAAGEMGAIKRFVRFPVDTFELNGKMSPAVLEEATTPVPSQISVDGSWPDKKLLLITFGGEGYYVLYRAVEMNNQARWDTKMAASGGPVCSNGTPIASRRVGRDPNSQTAATKGFVSPC